MDPGCELLIGADDRSGALEAAGSAAEATGAPVTVLVGALLGSLESEPAVLSSVVSGRVVTVDLGSRHLSAAVAGERSALLDRIPSRRHLHKIDSTLRGRWAAELVARSAGGSRPVLLVPTLPSLGRVCVDGVVSVDGRPVGDGAAGADVLAPPGSSRPDELLARSGADQVYPVRDVGELAEWLVRPRGIAVADASTDDEVADLVATCWEHPEVLLAGTSAMALAAARLLGTSSDPRANSSAARLAPISPGRILVVVGSAHPAAAEQVGRLHQRGARLVAPDEPVDPGWGSGAPVVVAANGRPSSRITLDAAERHARDLAAAAARWTEELDPEVMVVIGGDTAAALLGDEPVEVEGLIAPGTAWARHPATGRIIVTRAGGFGGPDALVELLWGTLVR